MRQLHIRVELTCLDSEQTEAADQVILVLLVLLQSGHKVGEKFTEFYLGFFRAINLHFHRLSQQKVSVIMTFVRGHYTSNSSSITGHHRQKFRVFHVQRFQVGGQPVLVLILLTIVLVASNTLLHSLCAMCSVFIMFTKKTSAFVFVYLHHCWLNFVYSFRANVNLQVQKKDI